MNRIRSQNRINVHGSDIPDPVYTFEELQSEYHLNTRILQNLREAGLSSPTPIQMQAIPVMMHVSMETHIQSWVCAVHPSICDHFYVTCVWFRAVSCWPALPQDQGRLWRSVSHCLPTCSSQLTLDLEL